MVDLRRFPRVPLGQPVEFSTKDEDTPIRMDGVGKDISLGGMFIETELPGPVGERLVVYLVLPGSTHEMALPAVVRWTGKDGMGVQFGLLGAHDTYAITEFEKTNARAGKR